MQIDALALQLRPRPMFEAADLGVRLVQVHARSVWRCYAPLWAVFTVIALSTVEIASWLPWLVIFCAKPWLDRTLLHVFSRAAFGEETRWADVWRAQRQVWWSGLLSTLILQRLSAWRSYTQPVRQLEGQSGGALRKRARQVLAGKRGAAFGMHLCFAHFEALLMGGFYALGVWLTPGDGHLSLFRWMTGSQDLTASLVAAVAYALAVLLLEPFYVASGFAMYLNRRVELEAWDIEREFRRAFA